MVRAAGQRVVPLPTPPACVRHESVRSVLPAAPGLSRRRRPGRSAARAAGYADRVDAAAGRYSAPSSREEFTSRQRNDIFGRLWSV